jgi:hypothetical protein
MSAELEAAIEESDAFTFLAIDNSKKGGSIEKGFLFAMLAIRAEIRCARLEAEARLEPGLIE